MKNIPESEVVRLWQQRVSHQRRLLDSEGQPVEVVFPGRLNDGRGGDFRDAIVTTGSTCQTGTIEIHTRTDGWQSHGHHLDPAYNQVVLHVALEGVPGSTAKTVLQNGNVVPTVILGSENFSRAGPRQVSGLPCRGIGRNLPSDDLAQALEASGERRLDIKAGRFQSATVILSPAQVLYSGLTEALGYTKNQRPFQELARQFTLSLINEVLATEKQDGLLSLQANLLGKAGLLPSQRKLQICRDIYIEQLEQTWLAFNSPPVLSARNWELFKVRPGNYPVRRLIALSYLLFRFHPPRWPDVFLNIIRYTPPERARKVLESALHVPAEGYWTGHYDFARAHPSLWGPVLLGGERAAEMTLNVVLPFALNRSRMEADPILGRNARQIYLSYPRLETNSIERHMHGQLSLPQTLVNSACRQQGLLHIYKEICTQGKCTDCIFAR